MKRRILRPLAAALVAIVGVAGCAQAQAPVPSDYPFDQHLPAPPLDGGAGWLNTAGPIELESLRGKFVVLDFWTYCCINCMHVLPVLKQIEQAYPNEVVVIGVHSAKFTTEQDSQNIASAVMRYEIEHPVINDAEHRIWDRYGCQSWPSIRIIDPLGNVVAGHSGEIDFATLDGFFKQHLRYYRKRKLLNETPVHFDLEAMRAAQTPLRFPGKVLADEAGDRLFISDSNHNRIVITDLAGKLQDTIGSGAPGADDGDYATARFDHPQGVALHGDTLYVADTENHLLRRVDLAKRTVTTVAGTGRQGSGWPGLDGDRYLPGVTETPKRFVGPARKTALNSPWALWVHEGALYIAMAGPHQIWRMPLDESEIGPYAGNGREDIVDGPLLPKQPYALGAASFAQPSGLASDGRSLFVVDSEGSSIRRVPFEPGGVVQTIVGTAGLPVNRLFTFGDADGPPDRAQLQHPIDVLYHDGLLYVADTYNNKIKTIDPNNGTVATLVGDREPGSGDEPARFDEPAGVAVAGGKLYVADTNNHAIRVVDLANGNRVSTLAIEGLTPPAPVAPSTKPAFPNAKTVKVNRQTVKLVDGEIHIEVTIDLPQGYKLNPQAPLTWLVEGTAEAGPIDRARLGQPERVEPPTSPVPIALPAAEGEDELRVSVNYLYCREGSEGLCKIGSTIWELPLTIATDKGKQEIELRAEAK